ncbi:MAG: beta-lactamase-like protein [Monoraphidium minutum]|nr:MAG: beta-lactamase-like protein [Monoraphidium minutum]
MHGQRCLARAIQSVSTTPSALFASGARSTAARTTTARRLSVRAAAGAAASGGAPGAGASSAGAMEVVRLPALSDNYMWLLRDGGSGKTAVVDPAEAGPVFAELKKRGWGLDYVLNTHHHGDHTGGNLELKRAFPGLQIVGPRADAARIPGIDVQVGDGDEFAFGGHAVRVFDTPGHTRGHITLWVPGAAALFPGDTLFALGCGRLFEGDPATMWASLSKLTPLPRETKVYCAHEYTASNARFAVSVNPGNAALAERKAAVDAARARGEPTVPSTLGEELDTNPFLRTRDPEIRSKLGLGADAEDWRVFGAVRAAKDGFRG